MDTADENLNDTRSGYGRDDPFGPPPAQIRTSGITASYVVRHIRCGKSACPVRCGGGVVSDSVGLRIPVLLTGLLLPVSGLVLLVGRRYLVADLAAKLERNPPASS